MNISIVIPIYNESKNLNKLNKKIYFFLKKINFEIIFVDDNSTDDSVLILKNICKKFLKTKFIIRRKEQRDLTQSCFLGVQKSMYQNILIMDGDLQHNPSDIPKMIKIFFDKKIDILIGIRDFKKKITGLSYIRFYISKLLIIFLNLFFDTKTNDPLSGFFIFKKKIYIKNKKYYFGKGYKILIDILYNTKDTIKVYDHKINFRLRNAESSKMNYKIAIIFLKFIFLCFFKKFKKIF